MAKNGTLFLDEISEIDPALQVKLLRVLEERTFERVGGQETLEADIRLIAATNRDLSQCVQEGKFRQDLFFRLNVVTINIPPLKDRVDDITILAQTFLKEFSSENNKTITAITPETMQALMAYSWPGNVRELRNVMERMVVLAQGNKLTKRDLPPGLRQDPLGQPGSARPAAASLEEANRQMIIATLEAQQGNRTRAAQQLGISRRTLQRKLREFGLLARPASRRRADGVGP